MSVQPAGTDLNPPPEHQPVTNWPAPAAEDRALRRRLPLFDRIKYLLLLGLIYLVLAWSFMAQFQVGFPEAANQVAFANPWLWVLAGLEVVRQVHFLISEHWAGYHRFWTKFVFGATDRWYRRRFNDWTRFRIARIGKVLLWLVVLALVLGAIYQESPLTALFRAPVAFLTALPLVLQLAFGFFFVMIQFIGLFWFLSRGGIDTYFPEDIKTRFTDVWGQDHVVARVKENIVYLENPEAIEEKGGYVPGGILLWGPPGTGKTLMAEAVAGETGKPYVFVDPGAFINMFMGVGVLKVKSLFRKLRKLALRYGGVIVFFDEADSLGNRGASAQGGNGVPGRSTPAPWAHTGCNGFAHLSEPTRELLAREALGHDLAEPAPDTGRRSQVMMGGMGMGGGGAGTLQALLTELSGLKKPRGLINRYVRRALGMRPKPPPKYRIMVMMATNMPEALDEALLRPGRIDRIYKVGYPSKAGRIRTYDGYLAKVPHALTPEQVDKLATITPYATGATIKDTVNEALITAFRDGREVITWSDMMRAKQAKELGPSEDVEYIERERHAVAVHEACHAVIAYQTRKHLEIDIATIEKGSTYLGMVASIPPEDQFTRWRTEYESDILVSVASLAGERLFFGGDNSSGVSGDLESATSIATYMEAHWGMGSTVSSFAASRRLEVGAPSGKAGKDDEADRLELRHALADRIEEKLVGLLEEADRLLTHHRGQVLGLAAALERHKTLAGEDVVAVLEGRQGPIIDGRGYGDPGFLHALERYHEAAAAAHHAHAPLRAELPKPPTPLPPLEPPDFGEQFAPSESIWAHPAGSPDAVAMAPEERGGP
ncbi:MAG: AAA family ATPase [Propionicimonas sp.]|nr:AAA family ATPase [Propionicimonas sp.]